MVAELRVTGSQSVGWKEGGSGRRIRAGGDLFSEGLSNKLVGEARVN